MQRQTLRQSPKAAVVAGLLLATTLLSAKQSTAAPSLSPSRDISGMYTFLQEGEFVQINVERAQPSVEGARESVQESRTRMTRTPETAGSAPAAVPKSPRVTGFISRFGDLESDKGAFLDHFFLKATLYGNEISFTTRTVHGVWFEFKGKVERGTAQKPAEEGYYIIRGALKRNSVDAATKKTASQSRELVMKSFPDLDVDDPGSRD